MQAGREGAPVLGLGAGEDGKYMYIYSRGKGDERYVLLGLLAWFVSPR